VLLGEEGKAEGISSGLTATVRC